MSFKSENEAVKAAKATLKRIKTKGWAIRVWENIGWHYALQNEYMNIYPNYETGSKEFFISLMADEARENYGYPAFTDRFRHSNINKVIEHQLELAKNYAARINKIIKQQVKALNGRK